jgi:hypothetical protein
VTLFGIPGAIGKGQTKCAMCKAVKPDRDITRVGDDNDPICPDCHDWMEDSPETFWEAMFGIY